MKKKLPGLIVFVLGLLTLLSGATSNVYILIVAISLLVLGGWLMAKL